MGLTLRNLANKIGDVAGGIERQVNPFDNGATYSNPQGNGQQLSVAQQIERPVANFVQQKVAQPAVQEYQGFMGSPVANAVRFGIAKLTDNPIAANNASDATKTSFDNTFKSAGTPQPTAQYVNGRIVLNPQKVNTITSLASGMGETLKTPGEIPLDKAAPKEVSTPKPVAQPVARPKVTAKNQPDILQHYTTPEAAAQLQAGKPFDYSKDPIHGTGNLTTGKTNGKLVNDGNPALYLSRDDKTWSVANIPKKNPEVVNIDNITPKQMEEGYFQKNGITPQYDYKQQKYVGYKNAFTSKKLTGVGYALRTDARRLNIDSAATLKKVSQSLGVQPDDPRFWSALRKNYDVVDITNTAKNQAVEGSGRKFFKAAKADQTIVLNPNAAEPIGKNGLPLSLTKELTASPPKPGTDQYAEMMDNVEPSRPRVTAKQPNLNPGAFSKEDQAYLSKLNAEEKANLAPEQQMKLAQMEGAQAGDNGQKTFNGPPLKLKSQQPSNKIALTAETPKAAIGENTYIMGERSRRYNSAINIGDKLSEGDKAKLSDAVNGKDVGEVDNPERFNKTVSALKDAHDYSLAADRLGGSKTARFNKGNFSPLYFKASPEALDKLGIPKDEQYDLGNGASAYVQAGENSPLTAGKYNGYRNIQRKYGSYTEAAQQTKGILQPLNKNALEDARMYANGGHRTIEGNLLFKQLQKIAPGEVSEDLNARTAPNGERLVHAANGELPFAVTERLNKSLTGFKTSKIDNPLGEAALKTVEAPAKFLRKVAFVGAPIHYANLTRSFLSTTIPSVHGITAIRGVGEALGGSIHPKIYEALQNAADTVKPGQEFSPREFAGKLGIVDRDTRPNLLGKGTGFKGQAEKYSPFALQMRNMNRFNNVLGWKLAERVQELGVKPGTAHATAIGTELNKVIDRINPKMEGLNPIGERLATSGSIAPHWIRANIGLVKDALVQTAKGNGKTGFGLQNAGDIARTNVIGGRLVVGATAVLASALATGQMPNLQRAINQMGFNPNNPYPNVEGNSKTKSKYPGGPRETQVTNLPSDPIGLAVGLLTDPKHFAIARETPALSAATQAATNQDFFGNPVVDKSQPGWEKQLAVKTAEKLLPFTVQSAQNKALTPGQKAESALGLRTKTNPNDPNYLQTQNYFNAVDENSKGLDRQSKDAYDLWTGSKKNPTTGKYDVQPNVNDARAKAAALLQNPKALDAIVNLNKTVASKGQSSDPLWNLSKDQIKSYLQYQAMPPGGPDKTDWYNKNQSWYAPLIDQRNAFFDALPPGDPNKPKLDIQYPSATPQVTDLMNQYSSLTDSTQKADFLDAHPDLIKQWNAQADYTNKLRDALGYTPLKNYPEPSDNTQKFMDTYNAADKATRKAIRNSDPQGYQSMIGYFDSLDLYNIGKQASVSQLKGEPDYTSKEAKAVASLAKDIYINPDGTYQVAPAGWMQGLTSAISGGNGSKTGYTSNRVSFSKAKLLATGKYMVDSDAGGGRKVARLKAGKRPSVKKAANSGPKVATMVSGKPRVSTKRSLV